MCAGLLLQRLSCIFALFLVCSNCSFDQRATCATFDWDTLAFHIRKQEKIQSFASHTLDQPVWVTWQDKCVAYFLRTDFLFLVYFYVSCLVIVFSGWPSFCLFNLSFVVAFILPCKPLLWPCLEKCHTDEDLFSFFFIFVKIKPPEIHKTFQFIDQCLYNTQHSHNYFW